MCVGIMDIWDRASKGLSPVLSFLKADWSSLAVSLS